MPTHHAPSSDALAFNTLFNQTQASEEYVQYTLGPCVFGWLAQIALWGVVLAQAAEYVKSDLYRRDPPRRRRLLQAAVLVCTVQTGFNVYLVFHYTTAQARDAASITRPTIIDALQPLSLLFLAPMVQSFLAKRAIGLLTAHWAKLAARAFFSVVIVCEIAAILFNIVISVLTAYNHLNGKLLEVSYYSLATGIWLWLTALTDVGVTLLLILVLRKRIAGFNSSTDAMLRALMKLAIQSASYTAILATCGAITSYATPNSIKLASIPLPFWYSLSSAYVLALLTALRSRTALRAASSGHLTDPVTAAGGGGGGGMKGMRTASPGASMVAINVTPGTPALGLAHGASGGPHSPYLHAARAGSPSPSRSPTGSPRRARGIGAAPAPYLDMRAERRRPEGRVAVAQHVEIQVDSEHEEDGEGVGEEEFMRRGEGRGSASTAGSAEKGEKGGGVGL
ncbi:hypothetical protein JCM10207_001278 [Rhodosporidiobolus poonsookiae]